MLHSLRPASGSRFTRKRVARGNSAGGGTTAGRGTKGQQSRTGKGRRFGFEGGQTPLLRRQPKLGGFTPPRAVSHEALTLKALQKKLPAGTYGPEELRAAGLIKRSLPVKLLGNEAVSKKYVLTVNATSKGARKAVEAAGGSVTVRR